MIKISFNKSLLLVFVMLASDACAEGKATLHKFAGYEMGYGTYRFEEKLDHKIVFPVASITAGLAYRRFSYVLNVSGSLSDAGISEEEQLGHGSRRDIDLTIGYQLNKSVSVFAGYKDGVSKLSLLNRDPLAVSGNGNERYQQQGLYFGGSFNWAFKNAGKLSYSLAYAQLDARNVFVADEIFVPTPGEVFEFDDIDGSNKGTSSGFSSTISWTMPIKGNLLFRSRLKVNRYDQDISFEGNRFNNIVESSSMLLVGVTTVF